MLEALETLLVLAEAGTMSRTATRLRVTQSAVSKRIAALEAALGVKLLERSGRNVRLTPFALELSSRAQPLLSELRSALAGQAQAARGRLVLGVAESILTAWGPSVLARVRRALPDLELELHAHRSPVALDAVRAGEFALAIVAGATESGESLWSEPLLQEDMVVVGWRGAERAPSARRRKRAARHPAAPAAASDFADLPPLMMIERRSATFRALAPQLLALRGQGIALEIGRELESFAGVVQLARHGFGPALVPWPLARALGVARADVLALPAPGLTRPVCLIGRKSALARPSVTAFRAALLHALRPVDGALAFRT
jgi:DNA-binding transcriptional LysR family regulator